MRTEQEMMDLILGFAKEDERVRAVVMNGSRVNPDAPRDRFQDYDIVFLVTDVGSFVQDRSWIEERFGQWIIMQTPDEMGPPSPDRKDKFAFLMLFEDGNRIDLTFFPASQASRIDQDSLSVLLLDKDGIVAPFPPPSNHDYLPRPPSAEQYAHCCNEFWWVNTYVAKGLWRKELPYAKFMFDRPVRDAFHKMLKWYIGIQTEFKADPGKVGKYFEQYLTPDEWTSFVKTFSDADYEKMWQALFEMGSLFRDCAKAVGEYFEYTYDLEEDERVSQYLRTGRED